MSRPKGIDHTQVHQRQAEELLKFNLVFSLDELAITRIRFQQARRREPSLADLCDEGIAEIDRVTKWMREIVTGGAVR